MLPVAYSGHSSPVDSMSSTTASEQSRRSRSRRFFSKPSWLLLSISDMADQIQSINGEDKPDSFGERAEFYYRKRPQLLALVQDLYNRYLYLADRYTRTLSKQQQQQQQQEYEVHDQEPEEEKCVILDDNDIHPDYSDDAQSSISYEPPFLPKKLDTSELVISELVMKFVEYDIVMDQLETADLVQEESKKKIELQRSLLEVLESERVVLTNENSRLASESLFMKRKAGELARCVLMERSEDHRVFILGRKIDDLQGQIYELEKRNKEYYDKLVKHEQEEKKSGKSININIKKLMMKSSASSSSLSWSGEEECCGSTSSTSNSSTCTSLAQVMKERKPPQGGGIGGTGKRISGWWDRVKKLDMFMCGQHLDSTR